MLNVKVKKIAIVIFCIFFALISVYLSDLSHDFFHKSHCRDDNCNKCKLIDIALNYTEFIRICISFVNISLLYIITLRMLGKSDEIFLIKLSLVNLKVRQNK